MPSPYKTVLVLGATSGIGRALASRLVHEGSYVIVVGRRKENLEEFVHEHGREKCSAVPFDVCELEKIPNFVVNITKTHTSLDCIILNSGIQRSMDFTKPDTVDMKVVQQEFTTNYLSYLAMTNAFLPFLNESGGTLIYMSSGLALVPLVRCPNYSATKAALHHWILCLREQLKGSKVKVVEMLPPAVQTELFDEKHQPGFKQGRTIGMPLDQFTDEAYEGLVAGKEEILFEYGNSRLWYDKIEPARQELFAKFVEQQKKS